MSFDAETLFERFTPQARTAIEEYAPRHAAQMQLRAIGTPQLLLGLMSRSHGIGAPTPVERLIHRYYGISRADVRQVAETLPQIVGEGVYTPGAERALRKASRMVATGHHVTRTDVVVALVDQPDAQFVQLLAALDIKPEHLRHLMMDAPVLAH